MIEKNKMTIGVEIETIYNVENVGKITAGPYRDGDRYVVRLPDGEYKRPNKSPKWIAERDSSIRVSGCTFNKSEPVELISDAVFGKAKFIETLNELKELMTNGKKIELHDIMYFNKSCGCHIHFSFNDCQFNKKCAYSSLVKVRKYFFDNLMKLDIDEEVKKTISARYFRKYSLRLKNNAWKNNYNNCAPRNNEFNFKSLDNNKGLEWRSFNLCGVKKWDEFFKLLSLAYDSVYQLRKYVKKFSDKSSHLFDKDVKETLEKKYIKNNKMVVMNRMQMTKKSVYNLKVKKSYTSTRLKKEGFNIFVKDDKENKSLDKFKPGFMSHKEWREVLDRFTELTFRTPNVNSKEDLNMILSIIEDVLDNNVRNYIPGVTESLNFRTGEFLVR